MRCGEVADTEILRTIAELAERREDLDKELTAAVRSARAKRSSPEIGVMLGMSKQAAQGKYSSKTSE